MHDVQFQYAITNRVRTRRTLESFATECPTELQKYTHTRMPKSRTSTHTQIGSNSTTAFELKI